MTPAYLLLDTETSCLNRGRTRDRGMVFELAARLLTSAMDPIADFESVIAPTEDLSEDNSEREAINMHMRNNLLADIEAAQDRGEPITLVEVRERFYAWLTANGVKEERRSIVMIGANPAFDRAFTERLFPEMERFLHYRMIDVATLREIAAQVSGLGTERLKLAMQTPDVVKHRAMGDVKFSYGELRCYSWMMSAGANAMLTDLKVRGLIG